MNNIYRCIIADNSPVNTWDYVLRKYQGDYIYFLSYLIWVSEMYYNYRLSYTSSKPSIGLVILATHQSIHIYWAFMSSRLC